MNPRLQRGPERILNRIVVEQRLYSTPCWIWQGSVGSNGYARLCYAGRRDSLAHRISYEIFVGPIPEGLHIDHLCRNKTCVNPDHLEPVTCGENIRRGIAGLANSLRNIGKTHCAQGHPYTAENVGHNGRSRFCRICGRKRKAAYKRRLREKARRHTAEIISIRSAHKIPKAPEHSRVPNK